MFRAAVLALTLASASAFVAPKAASAKVSLAAANDFADEMGAIPPVGFWDPLGLASNIDQETFERYRFLEIKHGRISQLAVLGYLFPEVLRFPGDIAPGLKFADVPHGIQALDSIPSFGWIQIIFLIGAVDYWKVFGDYDVGKVGSSISQGGILDQDEEMFYTRQTQEVRCGTNATIVQRRWRCTAMTFFWEIASSVGPQAAPPPARVPQCGALCLIH